MTACVSNETRPWLGYLSVFVVVLVWTGFVLMSRHGVKGTLTPWDIAALRFGVSGLIMAPFLWRLGLGELTLPQAVVLAITAGPGFGVFAYTGFSLAPAAHGAILMPGVLPLMTAVLGLFLLNEPLGSRRAIALAVIIAGVAMTSFSTLSMEENSAAQGDMLFLCAVTSWAFYTVLIRRWQVDAIAATAVVAPIAMVLFMPFYWLLLPSNIANTGWPEIIYQGAFHGVGAVIVVLLAFTTAVKHLGAQLTTMFTAIVPGLAAILAVPLLEEPLNGPTVAGIVFVTVGILTAATSANATKLNDG